MIYLWIGQSSDCKKQRGGLRITPHFFMEIRHKEKGEHTVTPDPSSRSRGTGDTLSRSLLVCHAWQRPDILYKMVLSRGHGPRWREQTEYQRAIPGPVYPSIYIYPVCIWGGEHWCKLGALWLTSTNTRRDTRRDEAGKVGGGGSKAITLFP